MKNLTPTLLLLVFTLCASSAHATITCAVTDLTTNPTTPPVVGSFIYEPTTHQATFLINGNKTVIACRSSWESSAHEGNLSYISCSHQNTGLGAELAFNPGEKEIEGQNPQAAELTDGDLISTVYGFSNCSGTR
jgi:hypothetical protein